jgi:tripeptide aminopeptidase
MDLERLLERTIAIQSIPAPTFSEGARAAWVFKEFSQFDLPPPEQDPIGNTFLRIPGSEGLPLVVSAHLDTVFPIDACLTIQRFPDRLMGPGVGDNAIAVAALLELAQDLSSQPLPGDVWLVANVGEEGLGNLMGMKRVVARFGDRISAYIVLEGMALGHIYHKGLPVRRFRITAEGQGGHSWIHYGRESAIHTLLTIGNEIIQTALPSKPKTTLNIGSFHGGTSINSIAQQACFDLDVRSESEEVLHQITDAIQRSIAKYDEKDIRITLSVIGERPGGGIQEDHPLVLSAIQALLSIDETSYFLEAGSTDASVPLSMGLPAICIGLTHGSGAHSMREYIEIPPLAKGYEALLRLIQSAFVHNTPTTLP